MASYQEKGDEKAVTSSLPDHHVEKGIFSQESDLTSQDADEAWVFLSTHPHAEEILAQGQAILDDKKSYDRLVRKIDLTVCPLLAAVYFLQFLDKTTLGYTAIMGLRTDTHLKGQDYSNLSMLFYIGTCTRGSNCANVDSSMIRLPCNGVSDAIPLAEDSSVVPLLVN